MQTRWRYVCSWCWLVLLLPLTMMAETRHIHLIKLLDNENHNYVIREGCRSISYGIDQEVQLLAANLGIDNVIPYDLSGPNFSLERLDRVLEYDLNYQERDIVIVVYVGHGYRDPGTTSRYPNLYFNGYDNSVNFAAIQDRLTDLNPSLLLNIVIACNVTVADHNEPPPYETINAVPDFATLPKGIRKRGLYSSLFADEPGITKIVNLFSAQEEYYTFISSDGGIFFNEILYTLQEVLGGVRYGGWGDICATIEDRTIERSTRKAIQQKPICEYALQYRPVEFSAPAANSFLSQTPCKVASRDLRRSQRQQLRDLRRIHRDRMREAKRLGTDRYNRRLLAQEQRVEYESRKLSHEKEYQRRLQQCR